MKAAVFVMLALTTTASAELSYVAEDEEPPAEPEPLTKLGWRFGFTHMPFETTTLAGFSISIGVDHEVWGKLRAMAEYEWMLLGALPEDVAMDLDPSRTMAHRSHLGVRREILAKRIDRINLYVDLEAGGGLGIFEVPGAELATHGFLGVRAGWQMTKRRARASRTFEVEMQFRALAVEHGVGFSGGMGFWWGD